jgi:hypothetical protein
MKALMVNVTPAVAAGIYSGKKYIPVRQFPNLAGAKDVTVYICEGDKVTGTATYVSCKAQKEPFEGAVEDIYHLYVAWEIANAQKYPQAKTFAEAGLKKSGLEWAYVK